MTETWAERLRPYAGSSMSLWIEDRSGERQTKPRPYTLYKVESADEGKQLLFYINKSQYLSVPILDEGQTILEPRPGGVCFVSHDDAAQLHYWVELKGG